MSVTLTGLPRGIVCRPQVGQNAGACGPHQPAWHAVHATVFQMDDGTLEARLFAHRLRLERGGDAVGDGVA